MVLTAISHCVLCSALIPSCLLENETGVTADLIPFSYVICVAGSH